MPERQLRLLVACGAAGGISATFNAPIAGVFFALELILGDFETRSFGLVVLSSVAADAIGRAVFGSNPFLRLPPFHFGSPVELLLYGGLGVIATGVGLGFVRILYAGEDLSDKLWGSRPEWLRPAVGGAFLGLLLLAIPEMYGVGYPVLQLAVAGHYVVLALLGLLAAKILATSLTMWIGGSGGVFAPSLFMGAMLGSAYGAAAHSLLPGIAVAAGAYGLVGMGAVFAAAARAPITAVIIIFELTGDYQIILPLMVAVVVATALSSELTRDTIYTLKLRRRGIDIARPMKPGLLEQFLVSEAMGDPRPAFEPDSTIADLIERFAALDLATLPLATTDGELAGIVSAADLDAAVSEVEDPPTLDGLLRNAASVRANESLESAMKVLAAEDDGVPVLAAQSDRRSDGSPIATCCAHTRPAAATRRRSRSLIGVVVRSPRCDGGDRTIDLGWIQPVNKGALRVREMALDETLGVSRADRAVAHRTAASAQTSGKGQTDSRRPQQLP